MKYKSYVISALVPDGPQERIYYTGDRRNPWGHLFEAVTFNTHSAAIATITKRWNMGEVIDLNLEVEEHEL